MPLRNRPVPAAAVLVIITGDLDERDDPAGGVADEGGGDELTAGQHHLDGGGVSLVAARLQRVVDRVLAWENRNNIIVNKLTNVEELKVGRKKYLKPVLITVRYLLKTNLSLELSHKSCILNFDSV